MKELSITPNRCVTTAATLTLSPASPRLPSEIGDNQHPLQLAIVDDVKLIPSRSTGSARRKRQLKGGIGEAGRETKHSLLLRPVEIFPCSITLNAALKRYKRDGSFSTPKVLMTRRFLPLLVLTPLVSAATYNLARDYSGETFFDGWNFFGAADGPNNGDAMFVTKEAGTTGDNRLAYVDPNTKRAIIKVDNTTQVIYNNKRNTVRIDTKDTYPIGSVWVADMHHVPYGCSVWPACPTEEWPAGGEIDTFEGVNLVEQNQISLHTDQGCKVVNPVQSSTDVRSPDCAVGGDNKNQGCIVMDPDHRSYGKPFADAGGGVFVTELASSGIS
ncbi:hypothetical protein AAF712_000406 [Marasmius tenuissimus]|uniref:GH16 domain-containing protein n=1 Tax=Marasmius tenuissimus TaxID=585030 RepID=A0ABR3AFX9_9AGAR